MTHGSAFYAPLFLFYAEENHNSSAGERIEGNGWEIEIADGHLVIGDGYDAFDVKSETDYRSFMADLRKLADKLGWSDPE